MPELAATQVNEYMKSSMKARLIAILVSVLMGCPVTRTEIQNPAVTTSPGNSGNSYLTICKYFGNDAHNNEENMTSMLCIGWVEGFVAGADAAEDYIGVTGKGLSCAPDEVTFGQYERIIYKYISDHPETSHEPTRLLAARALHQAFPCKVR
jgi:Rap1a immunity proteins